MRRTTLLFSVALITFVVGVMAATFWFIYRIPAAEYLEDPNCFRPAPEEVSIVRCVPPEAPIEICDLVQSPDRYDGKIVRVRAAISGYHHQHLFDQSCSHEHTQTLVDYDSSDAGGKLIGTIAELPDLRIKEGYIRAELIVIGRFESSNAQRIAELMAWYGDEEMQRRVHPVKDKFLFTIMEVERVKICEPKLCGEVPPNNSFNPTPR